MNEHDLKQKDKETGEYLDLCAYCRFESNQAIYSQVELIFNEPIDTED